MDEVLAHGELSRLLAALQLGDSFFPAGRYTLSHGLEAFSQSGLVKDPSDVEALIGDYLVHAVGPSEAVAVASSNQAVTVGDMATVVEVDRLLFAIKLPAEASASSVRTGRQMLVAARRSGGTAAIEEYSRQVSELGAPGNHAVAFGVVSAAWGLSPVKAAAVELHAYLTGLLGAALRLVRMGHDDAQGILVRLRSTVAETASKAAATDYLEMSAFAPVIEIMQMRHEDSHLRLFAS